MKNYIQEGDVLDAVAPAAGVKSGDVVIVGDLVGIANTDATVGLPYALSLEGVYAVPKTTGQSWAMGDKLYADATGTLSKTATNNTFAGHASEPAASADATGRLRLYN